jgi:hypothetical protein
MRAGSKEPSRRLYVLHGREDPPERTFQELNTVPIDIDAQGDAELKAFFKTLFETALGRPSA